MKNMSTWRHIYLTTTRLIRHGLNDDVVGTLPMPQTHVVTRMNLVIISHFFIGFLKDNVIVAESQRFI